ncbi:MAG: UDP-N-acetylmuramoyl-tripeptide--D-alanyl-D-alanine ligase [Nitrospirota bacterium]|nr:MAG: UDP-N-acetylmuramoyl-tripeptide--D-alanyl-D-alanine ligase [Nitrospirota bacterium]
MGTYTLDEILEATRGRVLYRGIEEFSGISIDSRKITSSELFVALRGARFDGHDFLDEALKKGAGAIVNYPPTVPTDGKTIIHVNNTLRSLQDIASYQRKKRDIKVIGITGTNGKTTTKEMLCSILRGHMNILCSSGNLNNHIGLPLNLLKLNSEDVCVLEMGASKRGDIMELCEIASPDIGLITNIGPGHLEGFGSIDTVRDTKMELAEYVGTLIINSDDDMLSEALKTLKGADNKRIVTYGINTGSTVMARNVHAVDLPEGKVSTHGFDLMIEGMEPVRINLRMTGWFNVYNALAASAAGYVMGVPLDVIKKGLEEFEGVAMRVEIKEMGGAVVISDVYNANPASMEEAIKELVRLREGKAIAVLGDMLELGSYAEEAHRKLGSWLAGLPIDTFVAVGPLMALAADECKQVRNGHVKEVYTATDSDEAKGIVMSIARKGDTILIKGSRGMNMEYILGRNGAV